ncbi:MAG: hypothetical protein ACR2QK_11600 [Acidimicrobiales bacterium]
MRRIPSVWLCAALAIGLLAAACSSDGEEEFPPIATPAETTTTVAVDETEPPPTATTATGSGQDPEQAALDAWTMVLTAARTGTPDAEQLDVIASLADADTAEQLQTFFPEAPGREITFHPQATAQDDGTVAIDDCIVMNRGISTGFSNWLIGTASQTGDGDTWIIEDINLVNLDPCVPRSIATAAIEGYEAHWDAAEVFYNPPDADAPELRMTATGGYLDFVLGLIEEMQANGHYIRGRPSTGPEFFELSSASEVTIIDCQETNPAFGVYLQSSDERTDLIPPIKDGELELVQAKMILEDGLWKVQDLQGRSDVECRTPPLPETIPQTGG